MITLYLATNTSNGKKYVGQTSQTLKRRISSHKRDAINRNYQTVLAGAIRKHGWESFSWKILATCEDGETADWLEQSLIRVLDTHCSTGKGYNRAIGGRVRRGWNHTEETLRKFVGRSSWNKGTKGLMIAWNKGKSGWVVKDEKRQQELREQVSIQMKNNNYAKGNTNNRKSVRCIDTGEVFPSLYHASEWVRGVFDRSDISSVCNGRRKTAYGYRWEFVCQ